MNATLKDVEECVARVCGGIDVERSFHSKATRGLASTARYVLYRVLSERGWSGTDIAATYKRHPSSIPHAIKSFPVEHEPLVSASLAEVKKLEANGLTIAAAAPMAVEKPPAAPTVAPSQSRETQATDSNQFFKFRYGGFNYRVVLLHKALSSPSIIFEKESRDALGEISWTRTDPTLPPEVRAALCELMGFVNQ